MFEFKVEGTTFIELTLTHSKKKAAYNVSAIAGFGEKNVNTYGTQEKGSWISLKGETTAWYVDEEFADIKKAIIEREL